jgi:ketosteroid isomerase-like protein
MTDDLAAVEAAWADIVERRDVEAAEELLADDFLLSSTGGMGNRVTRQNWLDTLPRMETRTLTCEVLDTRVFGDVGVARARLTWAASVGDRDLTGVYLVADVFRLESGRWRAAWRISTRLPDSA